MKPIGIDPVSVRICTEDASQSTNSHTSTPENPSSMVPHGFSISNNAVSEEAWGDIRSYLGLSTSSLKRSGENDKINSNSTLQSHSIEIQGFRDESGSDSNVTANAAAATNISTETTIPWESTPTPQNRPVVQFGFRYDYQRDVVVPPNKEDGVVPEIPDIFRRHLLGPYCDKLRSKIASHAAVGDGSHEFTQCIVNVYRPSTPTNCSSIPWHVDDPQFGPEILVFCFGETRPLHMRRKHDREDKVDNEKHNKRSNDRERDSFSYFTAHPSHRSCYVLSGSARHDWEHSVPSGSGWRVSITFRTLRDDYTAASS